MSSSTYECFCRSVASLFGWSDWCQRFYSELECWDQANEVLRQSWPQSNDEWVSLAINYSLKYDISNPSASYATSDSYTTDNSNRTSGSKWPSHDDETGTSESEKDKDSVVSSTSTTGTDTEKAGTSGDAGKTQIQFEKRPLAAPREKTLEEFWMPHRIPVDTLLPASYPFTVPLEDFSALLECSYAVPLSMFSSYIVIWSADTILDVDHSGNILSSSFASAVYSVLDSPNGMCQTAMTSCHKTSNDVSTRTSIQSLLVVLRFVYMPCASIANRDPILSASTQHRRRRQDVGPGAFATNPETFARRTIDDVKFPAISGNASTNRSCELARGAGDVILLPFEGGPSVEPVLQQVYPVPRVSRRFGK